MELCIWEKRSLQNDIKWLFSQLLTASEWLVNSAIFYHGSLSISIFCMLSDAGFHHFRNHGIRWMILPMRLFVGIPLWYNDDFCPVYCFAKHGCNANHISANETQSWKSLPLLGRMDKCLQAEKKRKNKHVETCSVRRVAVETRGCVNAPNGRLLLFTCLNYRPWLVDRANQNSWSDTVPVLPITICTHGRAFRAGNRMLLNIMRSISIKNLNETACFVSSVWILTHDLFHHPSLIWTNSNDLENIAQINYYLAAGLLFNDETAFCDAY